MDQRSALEELSSGWASRTAFLGSAEFTAPYGRRFPGLASAASVPLPAAELQQAVSGLPPGYMGLVAARTAADIPATVGWSTFGSDNAGPGARSLAITAVLRSWEARFGARLLQIGADSVLRVLVERPPRTAEHAQQIAAEHIAFADGFDGESGSTVVSRAASIVGAPIWSFWWD